MQFLRNAWAQIRVQMEQLSPAQRWLIGALMVVLLLVGFIVAQYAGRPQQVAITRFAGERQDEAAARLKQAGIDVTIDGGQMLVAADKQVDALVVLQQAALMSPDTSSAFDDMLASTTAFDHWGKTRTALLIAKQKVLASIVAKMQGVGTADVVISLPEDTGFGKHFVRPSGAVTITMKGNARVDRNLVQAVAGLVAGAVAEMKPEDVVVIDANHGRQHTVKNQGEFDSDAEMEMVQRLEQYHRDKIQELLGYIPNVIVTVNVQTDAIRQKSEDTFTYAESEPLESQRDEENLRRDIRSAAEPGTRANAGATIDGGNSEGRSESQTLTEQKFREKPLTARSSTVFAPRRVRQINVSINVPRGFFVSLWRQGQAADAQPPDDTALATVRDAQLAQIVSQVEPLISADAEGVVRAHMIPDASVLGPVNAGVATPTGIAGIGALLATSPWTKPAVVGMLALVSIGLMLAMVRKATRPETLPSVQELAGVPPELPTDEDLVGEAGETNAALEGLELNDDELRVREIANQISEMVKGNPTEAGALIGRWVKKED